jgi:hypothetical protein
MKAYISRGSGRNMKVLNFPAVNIEESLLNQENQAVTGKT